MMHLIRIPNPCAKMQEVPFRTLVGPDEWLQRTSYPEFTWRELKHVTTCSILPSLEELTVNHTTHLRGFIRLHHKDSEKGSWNIWSIQIWLAHNEYTQATEDKCIAVQEEFTLTHGTRTASMLEEYICTSLRKVLG
jgi:hypothetical protein